MPTADFDLESAHRYFSAECFNRTWDLIDKEARTEQEDEEMIALCFASIYHWSQRPDVTDKHRSIGYWQASRVYALARRPDEARRYGAQSLEASRKPGVAPFYQGYAYEALARAESVARNHAAARDYVAQARALLPQIADDESRQQLENDLNSIGMGE